MSRSIYKIPYIHKSLLAFKLKKKKKPLILSKLYSLKIALKNFFWIKNTLITSFLINQKKIGVYNGKIFLLLNLIKDHLGLKLGELVITRRMPKHKKKK